MFGPGVYVPDPTAGIVAVKDLRHWFSLMGTVLPFEITTYAI